MLIFNKKYFLPTVVLFLIEVFIAVFVFDSFIRPFGGDFLVVILLYCFIKSFFDISVKNAAIAVLIFSYLIEFLQYFKIVHLLGLQENKMAIIIIGTHFSWGDILAYTLGILTVLVIENLYRDGKD